MYTLISLLITFWYDLYRSLTNVFFYNKVLLKHFKAKHVMYVIMLQNYNIYYT